MEVTRNHIKLCGYAESSSTVLIEPTACHSGAGRNPEILANPLDSGLRRNDGMGEMAIKVKVWVIHDDDLGLLKNRIKLFRQTDDSILWESGGRALRQKVTLRRRPK